MDKRIRELLAELAPWLRIMAADRLELNDVDLRPKVQELLELIDNPGAERAGRTRRE